MSAGGKRVKGIRARHTVSRVARRALVARFATVQHYLPRAAKRSEEDMEYVHQLRVATRRGLAAMALFSDLLPQRRARMLARDLKRLRRAAGSARDLDVLATSIRASAANQGHADCQAILQVIWEHRRKAQRSIVTAHKALRRSHFRRRVRTLIDKTRWRCQSREPRFGEVAAGIACPLVTAFFAAATADLAKTEALHTMRIQAKRLRYALELLAPAFDRSLRNDLFAAFAQLQRRLGEINDLATATTLLEKWVGPGGIPDDAGRLAGWLATAREDLEQHREEFLDWWTAARTADLRRRFDLLLLK